MSNQSLAKSRKLMAEQAEAMQQHYEQDKSWQEWQNFDLGEIYDYLELEGRLTKEKDKLMRK